MVIILEYHSDMAIYIYRVCKGGRERRRKREGGREEREGEEEEE